MGGGFKDREKGFESKFAHDEEMRFKVMNRRNKLLGLWAAAEMGKSGADAETYAKASTVPLAPQKIDDTLAFMFETRWPITLTRHALDAPHRQTDYDHVWDALRPAFTPPPAPSPPPAPPTPATATPGASPLAQFPYLIVLACTVGGVIWALTGAHAVSNGAGVVGVAFLAAAVARLSLPQNAVGLLANRRRFADVLALGALGAALLVIAVVLPPT